MDTPYTYRPDFLNVAVQSPVENYYNATDILSLLNQAVDTEGVKLNINLTTQTYLYLALTGIVIFAAGAITWYSIGKAIKK